MKNRRTYRMSDAILLNHVGKVLNTLPGDLHKLEAQFPMIDTAFKEELQTVYLTALEEGGDEVALGKVGEKTQRMTELMRESRRLVRQLRFWVDYAFDSDGAARHAFNLRKFWSVVNNQPELIRFMYLLSTVVLERAPELLAAGASQALLDRIEANATSLASADADQEQSKRGRNNATQKRVNALNEIYSKSRLLADGASLTFDGDPVKVAFYSMPTTRTDEREEEEEEELME